MTRLSSAVLVASTLLFGACSPPPRPSHLADAEAASQAPASRDAAGFAPQAFAHAETLRAQAELAHQQGHPAAAGILGEHATVAYQHAAVLTRLARAVQQAQAAQKNLREAESELATLEAEQKHLLTEVNDLETHIKVLRDAEAPAATGKTDAARESARLTAARAMLTDARLLCTCTRLLGPESEALRDADTEWQRLDKQLETPPRRVPIDDVRRARSRCLDSLTRVRRTLAAPPSDAADTLLEQLSSQTDAAPFRDDRGVVVMLRDNLDIPAPGTTGTPIVDKIVTTATAHPKVPLLLVVHGRDASRLQARAKRLTQRLEAAGVPADRMHIEVAGDSQPLGQDHKERSNNRLEVVFVSPTL